MSRPVEAIDYVLNELAPPERAVAEDLLRSDAGFRAEVERLRPLVTQLENLPDAAWEGLVPPAAPTPKPARAPWFRWPERLVLRPALALGASLACIAVGIGIGVLAVGGDDAPEGRDIALTPLAAGADARAVATVSGDSLRIDVSDLAPTADGQFYELWMLNTPTDLVSVASFRVPASGSTTVTVPLPDDPTRYRFLDLSVEPADGKPAHSGKSVLRGETA